MLEMDWGLIGDACLIGDGQDFSVELWVKKYYVLPTEQDMSNKESLCNCILSLLLCVV